MFFDINKFTLLIVFLLSFLPTWLMGGKLGESILLGVGSVVFYILYKIRKN